VKVPSARLSSIIIAASQTLVAPVIFVFLLTELVGAEGIWYTIVAESASTAVLTVLLLLTRFKRSLLSEKESEYKGFF
jgi:Na+-driven multidrug efflux pump